MAAKRAVSPPAPAKAAQSKATKAPVVTTRSETAKPLPEKAGKAAAAPSAAAAKKAASNGRPPALPAIPAAPAPAPVATTKTIAAQIAERNGLEKGQAERLMTDIVAVLTEHLTTGSRIRLAGLGVLEVRVRRARMGRNPATGESIRIAASRKVVFRPAKEVKAAVTAE